MIYRANQRTQKVLFTCVVYTNIGYFCVRGVWDLGNGTITLRKAD